MNQNYYREKRIVCYERFFFRFRFRKNKLRVHHKAAIKSIKSHSEKIIATFPAPFSHEKLPISVIFSQNVRTIIANFSHSFSHLKLPIFWEIVGGIIANFSQNVRQIIANYRKIIALISPLETADFV